MNPLITHAIALALGFLAGAAVGAKNAAKVTALEARLVALEAKVGTKV